MGYAIIEYLLKALLSFSGNISVVSWGMRNMMGMDEFWSFEGGGVGWEKRQLPGGTAGGGRGKVGNIPRMIRPREL